MNVLILVSLALALGAQDPVLVTPRPTAQEARKSVEIPPGSKMVVFDVADLLIAQNSPAGRDPKSDEKETAEARARRDTEAFGDLLKRWMKPAFDANSDQIRVLAPGSLALVVGDEKMDWARRFLELQRRTKDYIDVQVRIFEAPRGTFSRFGIDVSTKIFERAADFAAFVAHGKDEGVNLDIAPRVLALPRQKATLYAGDQTAYVKEWRLEIVEPGPKWIGVPTIETIQDGIAVEALAVPLQDDVIGLELSFTRSKLERPIPTKKMRIGAGEGQEVEVGLPVVNKVGLDTRMSLADGASLVLVTASSDEGREIAVAVTLRRVRPEPK